MMLSTLLRASVDGAVLAVVIWGICRALPRLTPATRTVLWWCVTAKFLLALVLISPVAIPILPPSKARASETSVISGDSATAPAASFTGAAVAAVEPSSPELRWHVVVLSAWAIGVLAAAWVAARRWRQTKDTIAGSAPAPEHIRAIAAQLAARLRLRRTPDVLMSQDLPTPVVVGLRRPVVLLPAARFQMLSNDQQRMALCHELAHVRRADLWLGCVPAIAERLFFFHPVVHLAAREYAFWREAACDAAVLEALDAAPQEYGRLLLDLGVSRQPVSLAAAGAPWSFSSLKRRIAMLGVPSVRSTGWRVATMAAVSLSCLAMLPLELTARPSVRSAVQNEEPIEPRMVPPAAPQASEPANANDDEAVSQRREDERVKKERRLNFILFVDDNTTTMSGSISDIDRVRRFKRPDEQVLWFRVDDREYVVRDPRILDQVAEIWRPVNEIGDEQGRLGTRQGELGTRQGELGARQGELGAEQGRLGTQQGVLGSQQGVMAALEGRLKTAAEREAFEKKRRDIEEEMRALDRAMRALDGKMRELNAPMEELGRQMDVLGKEMEVLGAKMEKAVKEAEAEMEALIERAIQTGVAQQVR